MQKLYQIMHKDLPVCEINLKNGSVTIFHDDFLPYGIYLEESDDFDTRFQNVDNFYYWCSNRLLTLDRKYAKELLNSIGYMQSVTDRDRAIIALSYHCLNLTDVFWVKGSHETISYQSINLYENHLSNAFVDIGLRGKSMTVTNSELIADSMSTGGCYPKAWFRLQDRFILYKDGGYDDVIHEVIASELCQCFSCHQVPYSLGEYQKTPVSVSPIMTSLEYSIVPMRDFIIYAENHDFDYLNFILELDSHSYYMMNILDYLVGNTDRHWENWGLLIDNQTNRPIRLHDLMDFNKAFSAYDTMDGATCLTTKERQTQKEAAIYAVKQIGLPQIKEINSNIFRGDKEIERMFFKRLELLKEYNSLFQKS